MPEFGVRLPPCAAISPVRAPMCENVSARVVEPSERVCSQNFCTCPAPDMRRVACVQTLMMCCH